MKTALTIAGSDSCGGAGIQADIKTMTCNGVYAMSAITALTAQNTTGVSGIMEVTPEFLGAQIDAVVTDIFPDAVKTGMVSSAPLISVIAGKIREYALKNVVVDPVMIATSGSRLLNDDALKNLTEELIPLASVITPNIPEAQVLSGMEIKDSASMEKAAKAMSERFGCAVLLKGGHNLNDANDFLYDCKAGTGIAAGTAEKGIWFYGDRIENPNTHGTGCTLSSAIASNLAKGQPLSDAVKNAKSYISGALSAMLNLGKGSGPLMHNYVIKVS